MEHHPIPQDITGFQFKLIGEMTVKQFAYLAAGAVLAVVAFYSHLFFFLKLPLAILCAGFGAALAFLPVEGRPLDTMLSYYLKALFSPTQYVYQKTGRSLPVGTYSPQTVSSPRIQPVPPVSPPLPPQQPLSDRFTQIPVQQMADASSQQLATQPTYPQPEPVVSQEPQLQHPYSDVPSQFQMPQIISMHGDDKPRPVKQLPTIDDLPEEKPEEQKEAHVVSEEAQLEKEELILEKELAQAKLAEQQQQTADMSKAAHEKTLSLEEKLHEIASQKSQLEQELIALRKQVANAQQPVHTPQQVTATPALAEDKPVTAHVKQVPAQQARAIGLPQVADPNIIAGVIKDPRGNVLPNMLVEIMDSQSNPVRAFKTNQLGQFVSATPLPNGTYKMTFEDPKAQNTFDAVEIVAKGEIMLPLEIVSQDAREALRRELFS